jgi:hypothetical protein
MQKAASIEDRLRLHIGTSAVNKVTDPRRKTDGDPSTIRTCNPRGRKLPDFKQNQIHSSTDNHRIRAYNRFVMIRAAAPARFSPLVDPRLRP